MGSDCTPLNAWADRAIENIVPIGIADEGLEVLIDDLNAEIQSSQELSWQTALGEVLLRLKKIDFDKTSLQIRYLG